MRQKGSSSAGFFVASVLSPFMVVGLVALVAGARDEWRFQQRSAHGKGIVVDLDKRSRGTYAVVRYDAPNGASTKFRSRVRYSPAHYKVGQEVDVLFDPADPRSADIDSFDVRMDTHMSSIFGGGLILCSLGCAFIVHVASRWMGTRAAP
jgi:hypothetical protein